MTEVLFILTTIFVAYVIYVVVSEQKTTSNSEVHQAKAEKPVAAAVKQPIPQAAPKNETVASPKPVVAATPKPVPAEPKAAAAKPVVAVTSTPVAAAPQDAGKRGLKDPKSGEVATTYSNYRFTKRWIKEALVAEGLLEKVYKNDELNAEIEAKIKTAVSKLESIKKYQV